ncbi:hypothetical protein [Flavobacterium sp.]|uniref:hypothetical protein n=1 Tax=Flavobacterium sp. TaxID=239 RepID=UPI00333F7562
MKCFTISILLLCQVMFAQGNLVETYHYGQNSIEVISTSNEGTIIVSTFNAKMNIRKKIAEKILSLFIEDKLKSNFNYTIEETDANVTGNCIITVKDTLTSIDFYYEKVEWKAGITEIYIEPRLKSPISNALARN